MRLLHGLVLLSLSAALCLCGCRAQPPAPTTPPQPSAGPPQAGAADLKGKSVLMVVAPKDFRDVEYTMPREMLEGAGASIEVASTESGTAVGAEGTKVAVDLAAKNAKAADYDAVVFVGGPGMVAYLANPDFVRLAKESVSAGKVTAAICVAPAILANAGVLKGIEAIAFESERSTLKDKGAILSAQDAVRVGKIVTANGPEAAHHFAMLVMEALKGT